MDLRVVAARPHRSTLGDNDYLAIEIRYGERGVADIVQWDTGSYPGKFTVSLNPLRLRLSHTPYGRDLLKGRIDTQLQDSGPLESLIEALQYVEVALRYVQTYEQLRKADERVRD